MTEKQFNILLKSIELRMNSLGVAISTFNRLEKPISRLKRKVELCNLAVIYVELENKKKLLIDYVHS